MHAHPQVISCFLPLATGKTTTALLLVRAWIFSKKRPVLCAADSNVAVDNLVDGCAKAQLRVVRVGRPEVTRPDLEKYNLLEMMQLGCNVLEHASFPSFSSHIPSTSMIVPFRFDRSGFRGRPPFLENDRPCPAPHAAHWRTDLPMCGRNIYSIDGCGSQTLGTVSQTYSTSFYAILPLASLDRATKPYQNVACGMKPSQFCTKIVKAKASVFEMF